MGSREPKFSSCLGRWKRVFCAPARFPKEGSETHAIELRGGCGFIGLVQSLVQLLVALAS